jgi:hypothetical protein
MKRFMLSVFWKCTISWQLTSARNDISCLLRTTKPNGRVDAEKAVGGLAAMLEDPRLEPCALATLFACDVFSVTAPSVKKVTITRRILPEPYEAELERQGVRRWEPHGSVLLPQKSPYTGEVMAGPRLTVRDPESGKNLVVICCSDQIYRRRTS